MKRVGTGFMYLKRRSTCTRLNGAGRIWYSAGKSGGSCENVLKRRALQKIGHLLNSCDTISFLAILHVFGVFIEVQCKIIDCCHNFSVISFVTVGMYPNKMSSYQRQLATQRSNLGNLCPKSE
jgi:hypothetical protein